METQALNTTGPILGPYDSDWPWTFLPVLLGGVQGQPQSSMTLSRGHSLTTGSV